MKKTVFAIISAAFAASVMLTLGSCGGNAPSNDNATTAATTAQQYIGTAANASGENADTNAAQTDKSGNAGNAGNSGNSGNSGNGGNAGNANSEQTVAPNQPYTNGNNNGGAAQNKTTAKANVKKTTAKSDKTAAKTTKAANTTKKAANAATTNKNYNQDVYDPAMPDIF